MTSANTASENTNKTKQKGVKIRFDKIILKQGHIMRSKNISVHGCGGVVTELLLEGTGEEFGVGLGESAENTTHSC